MNEEKHSPIDESFQYHTLKDKYDKAVEALKEIEQGIGGYSKDRLRFAENVIHSMKNVTKECLDELGIEREVEQDA